MSRRGDIALVYIQFTDAAQGKVRPVVVVQNDRDNQRLRRTVVAIFTGNLRRLGDPSHLLADPATAEGASSGLSELSRVSSNNLFTNEQIRRDNTVHLWGGSSEPKGGWQWLQLSVSRALARRAGEEVR